MFFRLIKKNAMKNILIEIIDKQKVTQSPLGFKIWKDAARKALDSKSRVEDKKISKMLNFNSLVE